MDRRRRRRRARLSSASLGEFAARSPVGALRSVRNAGGQRHRLRDDRRVGRLNCRRTPAYDSRNTHVCVRWRLGRLHHLLQLRSGYVHAGAWRRPCRGILERGRAGRPGLGGYGSASIWVCRREGHSGLSHTARRFRSRSPDISNDTICDDERRAQNDTRALTGKTRAPFSRRPHLRLTLV